MHEARRIPDDLWSQNDINPTLNKITVTKSSLWNHVTNLGLYFACSVHAEYLIQHKHGIRGLWAYMYVRDTACEPSQYKTETLV